MRPFALAVLVVVALGPLAAGVLRAHDDAKAAEMGPPLEENGLVGKSLRPDDADTILDFAARNVALHSWLTPLDISGTPQLANDIWGYVSASGREYAILGLERGTAFVEVSDPVNPVVVEVIKGPRSIWRDMAVFGHYAYSVNEKNGGMQVIDLSRIDDGRVRLPKSVRALNLRTAHNITINPKSGYAYLSGSNLANGGLLIINLADPANPKIEPESWTKEYVHDIVVLSFKKGRYAGREIVFAFDGGRGVRIIDVSDKDDPFAISSAALRYPGLAYAHSGALSKNGRFLFVNDELDERRGIETKQTTTHVFNIKDLENPKFVGAYSNGSTAIDHNSMIQHKRLFLASYQAGLRVYRTQKPRNLREIAYFDTFPASDDNQFNGAWGVFAGFPSGNVIVSDIQRGLFVIAFDRS